MSSLCFGLEVSLLIEAIVKISTLEYSWLQRNWNQGQLFFSDENKIEVEITKSKLENM